AGRRPRGFRLLSLVLPDAFALQGYGDWQGQGVADEAQDGVRDAERGGASQDDDARLALALVRLDLRAVDQLSDNLQVGLNAAVAPRLAVGVGQAPGQVTDGPAAAQRKRHGGDQPRPHDTPRPERPGMLRDGAKKSSRIRESRGRRVFGWVRAR